MKKILSIIILICTLFGLHAQIKTTIIAELKNSHFKININDEGVLTDITDLRTGVNYLDTDSVSTLWLSGLTGK
ncbi:MAG TPA: hypothetical protein DCX89_05860 [Saprospirales bacterium]|nr:hypothetical protein [Saprospirales bacterium]HAY71398.1 hypothetical protein [Saprospirales bacterium]HRQ28990.1 hypothetical protein [Saprospiraceae bacterium]